MIDRHSDTFSAIVQFQGCDESYNTGARIGMKTYKDLPGIDSKAHDHPQPSQPQHHIQSTNSENTSCHRQHSPPARHDYQRMNSPPSRHSSPPTPPEINNSQQASTTHAQDLSPISNVPPTSHPTAQPAPASPLEATSSDSWVTPAPLIIITEPDPEAAGQQTDRATPVPRQGRSTAPQQRSGQSSSQPPRPSSSTNTVRSHSEPRTAPTTAMSSAGSSPANTTTTSGASGTSSGSNPGYHLPYAPFPYPMPGNARGGQNNQGSSSGGSGK